MKTSALYYPCSICGKEIGIYESTFYIKGEPYHSACVQAKENEPEIWVLTTEINEYDQYGEYYIRAWLKKPTAEEVRRVIESEYNPAFISKSETYTPEEIVETGGGRKGTEYRWFHLFKQGG